MKKFLLVFMLLSLTLFGCSKGDDQKEEQNVENVEETDKTDLFDDFQAKLEENDHQITEIDVIAGEMVGATEAKRFNLDDGTRVEVYKFEEDSEGYEYAVQEGKINLEGFGDMSVTLNGVYGLLTDDVPEEIVNIFKDL